MQFAEIYNRNIGDSDLTEYYKMKSASVKGEYEQLSFRQKQRKADHTKGVVDGLWKLKR